MQLAEVQAGKSATAAGRASYACALATILSFAIGIGIVVTMGVTSGAGVADATQDARLAALPLLVSAEVMKLVTGVALAFAVRLFGRVLGTSAITSAAGYLAAALVFAAGLVGLVALLTPAGAMLARAVVLLGILSLPLTGAWAAMSAWGGRLPGLLRWVAFALGVAGFLALAFPPVALLFGLLSLAWWTMLGRYAGRLSNRGSVPGEAASAS